MKIYIKKDIYGDVESAVESDECPDGYQCVGDAKRLMSLDGVQFHRIGESDPEWGGTAEYIDSAGTIYSDDEHRGAYGYLDIEKSAPLFAEQGLEIFQDWEFDETIFSDVHICTFEWDGSKYILSGWGEFLQPA